MSLTGRPALIYSRFSSAQQRFGISIERQYSEALQYIQHEGLVLLEDGHFSDEGVSAFKGKNVSQGALGDLMALLQSGDIPKDTVIIVEEISRLSRNNSYQALSLIQDIVNAGATIVTLHDRTVYTKEGFEENPMTLLLLLVHAQRAHSEAQSRSLRSKASQQKKREQRASGVRTLGRKPFYLDSKGNHVPEAVLLVKEIIDLYLSGMGVIKVAQVLNERGTPTPSNVGKWQQGTIQRLLKDPRLLGIQDAVPLYDPIISQELYQEIRQVAKGRLNTGRSSKTFSSCLKQVVTCGTCGSSLQIIRAGSGKRTVRCRTAQSKGCTNRKGISYRLSTIFVAYCSKDIISNLRIDAASKKEVKSTTYTQLEQTEKQIANLVSLAEMQGGIDAISARLTKVGAQRDGLKAQLAEEAVAGKASTFEEVIKLQRDTQELVELTIDGDGDIKASEALNRFFRLAGVVATLENRGDKQGIKCNDMWATRTSREDLVVYKDGSSEQFAYIRRTEDGTENIAGDYWLQVVIG